MSTRSCNSNSSPTICDRSSRKSRWLLLRWYRNYHCSILTFTVAVAVASVFITPALVDAAYTFGGGTAVTVPLHKVTTILLQKSYVHHKGHVIDTRGGASTISSTTSNNDEEDDDDDSDSDDIDIDTDTEVDNDSSIDDEVNADAMDAYTMLAKAIQSRFRGSNDININNNNYNGNDNNEPDIESLVRAFRILSSSHKAFKGLDGAAHEAYQRTQQRQRPKTATTSSEAAVETAGDGTIDESDLSISGRVKRNADRTATIALALWACELCEYMMQMMKMIQVHTTNYKNEEQLVKTTTTRTTSKNTDISSSPNTDVILPVDHDRIKVVFNGTNVTTIGLSNNGTVSILILYESSYHGGAGIFHGSIEDLSKISDGSTESTNDITNIGRMIIIIHDELHNDLYQMLPILEQSSRPIPMGRTTSQQQVVVHVQPTLYATAGSVLRVIAPIIQSYSNTTAIHFTGRVLSGGIAALAAAILHGSIPIPPSKPKQQQQQQRRSITDDTTKEEDNDTVQSIQGLGRGRVSAMVLGAPPCISSNVDVAFVKSILYGDDIIGRVSSDSLDRFYKRTRRAMEQKGMIGKKLNWMTDAASMATTNIQSQLFTSTEKKNKQLQSPGISYLIRPRRLGNHCSMHEIGSQIRGGRESLRAAILWQLNDVLLSRSLWKHHQLESYIHGLDRVHLRNLDDIYHDDD